MTKLDQLHRFLFNQAHVRGEMVRVNAALKSIIHSTEYPEPVQQLLADMTSVISLLTATLKIEGEVSMQIQSEGVLKYAVVSATNEQKIRGVARWDESVPALPEAFSELVKKAVLAITITPTEGERYQGIVALDKPTLAECIEAYFLQSEQLATKVVLLSDIAGEDPKAAGMLIQILPTSAESTRAEDTDFEHICQLAQTITTDEMFSLPAEDILYRLFHQEEVELFPAQAVTFSCTCSKERSAEALKNVDKAELLSIVEEEGLIKMSCQYCHAEYQFDGIDVEAIHSGNVTAPNNPQ